MIEVKSSTSVKDYQYDDIAIQAFVAKSEGARLKSIAIAHIDSSWVYQGNAEYSGLLVEHDLSDEDFSREEEVKAWLADAHNLVDQHTNLINI